MTKTLDDLNELLLRLGLRAEDRERVIELVQSLDPVTIRGADEETRVQKAIEADPVGYIVRKSQAGELNDQEKQLAWAITKAGLSEGLRDD